MNNFRTIDRQTGYLLPPSVDEWLPEKQLARFIVEVIDGLDLGRMSGAYRGSGSDSYHPRMLLGLLVYGYSTGVFSSRKLERATYAAWHGYGRFRQLRRPFLPIVHYERNTLHDQDRFSGSIPVDPAGQRKVATVFQPN